MEMPRQSSRNLRVCDLFGVRIKFDVDKYDVGTKSRRPTRDRSASSCESGADLEERPVGEAG